MITPLSKVIEINFNLTETINTLLANARTGKQFNTADTDAWFEFGFTDANIQNGTFNLTLINLKDESKFEHEGIAFNSNPFYYKLDSGADMQTNEIKHAGTWIGQLVVTLANGKSATQKFMFDIESHILDGTVASVTMLERYSVLMAQIENAKELLDQYNIDYAALLADLEAIYNSRLFTVEQQLADKAEKNEVFSMANMGADIRSAMTGGSVAVVGDGSVNIGQLAPTYQDKISEWSTIKGISWTDGAVEGTVGAVPTYGTQTYYKHATIPAYGGQRFRLKIDVANNQINVIAFLDADGKVISFYDKAAGTGNLTYTDMLITTPLGTKSMVVCHYFYLVETTVIETLALIDVTDFPDVKTRLLSLEDSLINFEDITSTLTLADGYGTAVIGSVPTYGVQTWWKHTTIDVMPGEEYKITNRLSQVGQWVYAFGDSAGLVTYIENPNTKGILVTGTVVPAGVSKFYVQSMIGDNDPFIIEKLTSVQIMDKINALEDSALPYPAYYDDHIQSKIAETQIVQESYINGDSFVYITDMHVAENRMNSPKLIGHLLKNLGIDKVFFGGDLVTAYGTKEEMFEMAYEGMNGLYSNVIPNGAKLYSMRGNHDLTIKLSAEATTGYTATRPETYNMLMRRQRDYFESVADNLYYYTDNVKQKIRYICLDTCELGREAEGTTNSWGVAYGVSQAQMDWLVNTALNITETGWTVLVFGHISITPSIPSYSSTLDGINEIMKAIKNKTAVSYTGNGLTINKDFSSFLPEVVGYICGHNHKDRSVTENGVLYVSTTCDAYYADDAIPRTVGTIAEGAFEIANLDTASKYLYLTRVGAGTSRFFTY